MANRTACDRSLTLAETEQWLAFGLGSALLLVSVSRKSAFSVPLAAASVPLFYRGVTGQWPAGLSGKHRDRPREALAGGRGVHVRESVRVERPLAEVYGYWRRLEHLPQFMPHLTRVTEAPGGRSHWVAKGPAGVAVEWDAEIISEVEHQRLAWASLPGSDVVTAGSVTFDPIRGGRGTQVTVHLQYAPPAGEAGALVARLFGREPSQTIREDLRRFRQVLEAGEAPRATATT